MGKRMECMQNHAHLGGKVDGCQEFRKSKRSDNCSVCGCDRYFHREEQVVEVEVEVVYTECHKNHNLQGSYSNDGCKEFKWIQGNDPLDCCAACGCHRNFHRNECVLEVSIYVVHPPIKYGTKCNKIHEFKYEVSVDGCQEFLPRGKTGTVEALTCAACGCHRNFHHKVAAATAAKVVYTKCNKIHAFKSQVSMDGCQEFVSSGKGLKCATCGCHRGFHQKVELAYTKCHKIHYLGYRLSVDGCLEFTPIGKVGMEAALKCAVCACHKSFHLTKITTGVTDTSSDFR